MSDAEKKDPKQQVIDLQTQVDDLKAEKNKNAAALSDSVAASARQKKWIYGAAGLAAVGVAASVYGFFKKSKSK